MIARLQNIGLGIPVLLLLLLALMTIQVPTLLLDVAFTFNIALSIVVLLASVYALQPLQFAAFPTVLLVATLMRLALNVASTRVVLLEGHEGGAAAGQVIEAFGEVLVGGNYVVGLVVFVVLVIINFVVVTKGAGRISEVSARFTLDAMPGKQMAIDADLNAGIIDQVKAKQRREEVSREADFYGAMDGASKFVRGDAVAGILIMLINVVGGLVIGVAQHDLSFSDALQKYTLLAIGDGLVAQLPSLLLSTAAAVIVTRVSSEHDMSAQIMKEMFDDPRSLGVTAAVLFVLGIVPGMPHAVFIILAAIAGGSAWLIARRTAARAGGDDDDLPAPAPPPEGTVDVGWEDVSPVDVLGLEVGYKLIPLVDRSQDGELLKRIKGVRKKLSQEFGFLVPSVHIRDNLELVPNGYRISLLGVTLGEAQIMVDRWMAIDPGEVFGSLEGIPTKDPAFGLSALWIEASQREAAQSLGYTVVDASTVVATHLNQVMQDHASELLGHDEVQKLVDLLAEISPKLAEQLVPGAVSLSGLLKILQSLLAEKIPIRDLRTIAEALTEASAVSKDPAFLLQAVRASLGRMIVQNIYGGEPTLDVITLDAELEQLLDQARRQGSDAAPVLEPGLAERLSNSLIAAADRQEIAGKPAVVLVSSALRAMLARFVKLSRRVIHVLAFEEIPDNKQITVVATIGRSG
ncbi:MAG: flagellar biosynthesis protein FlhA [Pseudomonadales bacterium]|nr:flagellar biosynthesis protein FlhA [Pseudomonadales bacterium]MCP5184763.1 flagellar biosynthesis protein FlhA [Pseudomonadales bacterium]